jgi:cation diffusion facilitator family transporter
MTKTEKASEKVLLKATQISLVVSVFVLSLKFYGYYLTGSLAVYSDALESIVNVSAALVGLLLMRVVVAPADADHPYGHGKLEYFSAAFEGGLIAFAAVMIAKEAISAMVEGPQLRKIDLGLGVMILASFPNLVLSLYLKNKGRILNSAALKASAKHIFSDVVTTVGVCLGLGAVLLTGYQIIDPLVALAVALHLGWEGVKIVRSSAGALLDEVDPDSLESLRAAIEKNLKPGLIEVHNLRMVRYGRFHHIDAHLVVPEFWDIHDTHQKVQDFEREIIGSYPFDGEMAFHLDPCARKYCRRCDLKDCPIRSADFQRKPVLTVTSLTQGPSLDDENHNGSI